jgi:uncharacterized membrane protein YqjE
MMSDERYPIEQPDKSLGELVGELTGELSTLLSTHVQLAKVELADEARTAARASAMLAAAVVAALLALAMLSAALGWGLSEAMAPGWAFLIVGLLWVAIAGGLALVGKQRIERLERPLPETMDEIKEDKRWLKTQTS